MRFVKKMLSVVALAIALWVSTSSSAFAWNGSAEIVMGSSEPCHILFNWDSATDEMSDIVQAQTCLYEETIPFDLSMSELNLTFSGTGNSEVSGLIDLNLGFYGSCVYYTDFYGPLTGAYADSGGIRNFDADAYHVSRLWGGYPCPSRLDDIYVQNGLIYL